MKIMLWLMGLFSFFSIFSCGPTGKKVQGNVTSDHTGPVLSGELLSLKYCKSCHLYPEPEILDKKTWERSVLPLMGRRFGIYETEVPRSQILEGAINKQLVIEQNIFPEKPLISQEEWRKITEYYIAAAPDSLPPAKTEIAHDYIRRFEIIKPLTGKAPIDATVVKIDSGSSDLYIGGSKGKLGSLTIMNRDFELLDEINLSSPPADIHIENDRMALTLVGSLRLMPSGNPFGELAYFLRNPGQERYSSYTNFVTGLSRPVQSLFSDISGKGLDDILVAEFGYYTGSLSLFRNSGGNNGKAYEKTVLKDVPGTVKACVADMNGDGKKDIVVLFAQGDEGISIFYNDGQGGFKEERVLTFSPSFGSVYFELIDMNHDGFLDILYCNGDNGDYRPILKDYHGLRVFENDGKNNFNQVYFYPMYGAFKASVADFDLDGDLDIFAISYFPDPHAQPRRDLVYLENNGEYSFSPQLLEKDIPARWVTFDIGDIDGNGYPDILLGALGGYQKVKQELDKSRNEVNSIVLLKNKGEKAKLKSPR